MNPEENNINAVPAPIQSTPTPEPPTQPVVQENNVPQPSVQTQADVKVSNRIGLAIVSFLLFWPLGIAALVNSSKVNKCLASGDTTGAQEASGKVKAIGMWAFGITALAIVGFVAIFGVVNAATAAPLKVSKQVLSYIAIGDAESAYALTSTEFQEATSESAFVSFVSTYKVIDFEAAKVTSKEVSTNDTSGTIAEITYNASSTTQEFVVTTYLVKSGDNWLVQNIGIEPK